ncbi:hypothetical protein [Carboxylicivirga caseinilyticus]|uniref:hypothetical protein n=1 Tax=Carboxylicivirga caseinilyticus TaxID=3417572 RepID=UPI003D3574BE|nr:SusF/SusE family outer membrane protein [Marinilabiliaceae bacterium A049]
MKRIILFLLAIYAFSTLQAKDWAIIGDALENDTTYLGQDPSNSNVYKYVGEITTGEFKLWDGTDNYIPVCGMNDPMGQEIGMEAQAIEGQTSFGLKYVKDAQMYVITLVDGASPTIKVELADVFEHVYLIGGPVSTTGSNWQLSDARELKRDADNQFIFYYRGFLIYNNSGDEPGAFKFLSSNSNWETSFHPVGPANVLLSQASTMRVNGDDTKWELPADGSENGYYTIKLNTLEQTIEVLEFTPSNVAYPEKVYLTGDAMPCGWVNDNPEVMITTNIIEGKYMWSGNVVPGQFKFLKVKNYWGSCYVSTIEDQLIENGGSYTVIYEGWGETSVNDFKFVFSESKECTISLDLSTMSLEVREGIVNSIVNVDNQEEKYFITGLNGILKAGSHDPTPMELSVYDLLGHEIYKNNFVSKTQVTVSKGFYIVVLSDQKNQVCKTVKYVY